jgi:predicted transposase YdaD
MVINIVLEKPREYGTIDYDGLWKKLIYELFEEFVLYFLEDLYEEIDLRKKPEFLLQELFKEIMDEKKGKQVADQIVKVFLKSGEEKWVLIHIEVQGERDPDFSKRMFRYYYRIFDKYDRDVVAIALLTDAAKSFRPHVYHRSSHGTKLTYEYNVYKFLDQNEMELLKSNNPFSIAVLAANYANEAKKDDEKRYLFKRKLIKLILQKTDYPKEERRIYVSALLYFIDYLLQIPIELTQRLRNEIILSKEAIDLMYLDRENLPPTFGELKRLERKEGREEGRKEGIEKGKREMAQKLLKEGVDAQVIMRASGLTREEVEKLAVELDN